MVDAFICRYGNQSLESVRKLSATDRALFYYALGQHLEKEYSPPDTPTEPPSQEP